jgi:hypothetical protein
MTTIQNEQFVAQVLHIALITRKPEQAACTILIVALSMPARYSQAQPGISDRSIFLMLCDVLLLREYCHALVSLNNLCVRHVSASASNG